LRINKNHRVTDGYNLDDLFNFCATNAFYFKFYHIYLSEDKTALNLDALPNFVYSKFGKTQIIDKVYEMLLDFIKKNSS